MAAIDHHVLFTLLQRGWTIIAGGISLLLIPHALTAIEQGYYYAFSSLIAMQVFFDLGFNSVIVQLVSHEYSHLSVDKQTGTLRGNHTHLSRLASLLIMLKSWYRIAAILFFVFLAPLGFIFFNHRGDLPFSVWLGPWLAQLFFTSINLYFSPFLAVTEGQGHIGDVAKLRLRQSMTAYFFFWIMLAMKAGLWATPVIALITSFMNMLWLRDRHKQILENKMDQDSSARISWRHEIFPFQWRIALSWISGYFIFSFFTPMIFQHQGAIPAGQIGTTLSIFSSLSALGMSWVSAKVPHFSMLIAQGKRTELNTLFISVTKRSFSFTAFICILFMSAYYIADCFSIPLTKRLSSLSIMLLMTMVTLTNVIIFSAAAYMRAHKEEPMLWNSVAMGVLVLTAVWFLSEVSVFATMASYAALVVLVSLPWTLLLLFKNYYYRTA